MVVLAQVFSNTVLTLEPLPCRAHPRTCQRACRTTTNPAGPPDPAAVPAHARNGAGMDRGAVVGERL
eukprot:6490959-Prymnesium_polylepis.1